MPFCISMSPSLDGVNAQFRWPCGTATRTYSLYNDLAWNRCQATLLWRSSPRHIPVCVIWPQCVDIMGLWHLMTWWCKEPGPWFNIKMPSYQYRKSHCGDKTILWPSYLHNGISYTGKTTSLYWIRAQVISMHDNDWLFSEYWIAGMARVKYKIRHN